MIFQDKIMSVNDAVLRLAPFRCLGLKLVQCQGVFDLLHIGHIRHLQAAKRFGDILAVTITGDTFVRKGPGRPAFIESLRAEALAALECVDLVVVSPHPTAVEFIHLLKPDFFVKGPEAKTDASAEFTAEREAVEHVGGTVAYTNESVWSATKLLNDYCDARGLN